MFSHVVVGYNDREASRAFYDALFAALGGAPGMDAEGARLIYRHAGAMLMVVPPIDGRPATPANGGTIGFAADSPEQVEAWHAAGLAHGGETTADPPGRRETGFGPLYLAYLRDPAGNKLGAVYRMPRA